MIHITRFDKTILYVNPHQIEFMEETPDLVITMLSGRKIVTKDSFETVLNRIVEYRKRIINEQFSITGKVAVITDAGGVWVATLPSVLCNKALKS